ncbi:MAG: carbon monoxide dehydrogenase beta subunit family protein [Candidatus Undinarchaeales archaeon]|jgi:CO dehydrogenase/acetyl-CoA synthase complex epsilon subunit|nr:carbon monoxide dehydrogenase beta subunit family protein [Candidatus Undinarchaeales archaeon]MDP7492154.1 carbon monoxide dehydrogenase beta subunit family protein [Candidatus Undinarchaeales archaeon]
MSVEAWNLGNVPGSKRARQLNEKIAAALLKKKCLVLMGAHTDPDLAGKLAKTAVKRKNMRLIGVGSGYKLLKNLTKKEPEYTTNLYAYLSRFKDDDEVEVVFIIGFPYYMKSAAFSHLKHFSKKISVNLSRFGQPNATYSLANMSEKSWKKMIDTILEG